jgi:hypothetical protein
MHVATADLIRWGVLNVVPVEAGVNRIEQWGVVYRVLTQSELFPTPCILLSIGRFQRLGMQRNTRHFSSAQFTQP